jgi:hypothetical protein
VTVPAGNRAAVAALAAYCLVVAWLLLSPTSAAPTAGVEWLADLAVGLGAPSAVASAEHVEFVANVGVMVPAAVLAALSWPRGSWRDWTAYGFVVAAGVEVVQAVLLTGRTATFVDVVANTVGVALGGLLVDLLRRRGEVPAGRPTGR